MPGRLGVERGRYVLVTLHRPSNVDDPARCASSSTRSHASRREAGRAAHPPATLKNARAFGLDALLATLRVIEPVGYREMLSLTDGAAAVLTDSGGLQEETTVLGVPCVTLRAQTERPTTVTEGTNRLAAWPLTVDGIIEAARGAMATGRCGVGERVPEGWDGGAAKRIVAALEAAASVK